MRRALLSAAAIVLLFTCGCGGGDEGAAGVAPRGFFGISPQDPPAAVEFARMSEGGIGTYRVNLTWAAIEREPGQFDWAETDRIMSELADQQIQPVGLVFGTPAYLEPDLRTPPLSSEDLADYRGFLKAAAERYGPSGTFWDIYGASRNDVEPTPIRVWQVWNEPNSSVFWSPEPNVSDYAKLLVTSARKLQEVEPDAKVMTGGMFATPQSPGAITSYDFLEQLFADPKAADATDVVDLHPYGPTTQSVVGQLERTYAVMKRAGLGDRETYATEIGWGSDPKGGSQDLSKSPGQQASLLRRTLGLLARRRSDWNLQGVIWYTWRDPSEYKGVCGWCRSAGLFDADFDPKPAWTAFTELAGGQP